MVAPGVQGHLCLARVGDPVYGILKVHAAARGLIRDPALRYAVAQGCACDRVPDRGHAPLSAAGRGCCLGHQPSPVQWPGFHAGQRAGVLLLGASSVGGPPSPPRSPSALMTSCAASSVGDRGRLLRGALGPAIVVSLCLRAGDGVRTSCGCPVLVAVRFFARAVGVVGCGLGSLNVGPAGWYRALHPGLRSEFACPLGRQVLPLDRPPICGTGSQSPPLEGGCGLLLL